jgi:hypothetical protein
MDSRAGSKKGGDNATTSGEHKDQIADSKIDSFSSPRRKLLQAKQQDEFFENETKKTETLSITRNISERLVQNAMSSVMGFVLLPSGKNK